MARFVINSESELLEIQCAKNIPSSYFINQRVKNDGSLFITTPIDPLYVLLPRLDQVRNKKEDEGNGVFVDKTQIFFSEEHPNLKFIEKCKNCNLGLICDVQGEEPDIYYRLNDTKVIEWLKRKIDQIGEEVAKMPGMMQFIRSQTAKYKSRKDEKLSSNHLLSLSLGFLSEYITSKWNTLLNEAYGLKATTSASVFSFSSSEIDPELIVETKYGTINDKRKVPDTPTNDKTTPKKRRVRAHDKIDTKKNSKLTSFFPIKKTEEKENK